MTDHKTNHNKFKKIEIMPNIFSEHNGKKLEMNRMKAEKFRNTWKLKIKKNPEQVKEENKRKVKKCLKTN